MTYSAQKIPKMNPHAKIQAQGSPIRNTILIKEIPNIGVVLLLRGYIRNFLTFLAKVG